MTQSLAQLKKVWYAKLKDSGFKDIEHYEDSLYGMTEPLYKQIVAPEVQQAKADYYTLATHFLIEHEFENELDKVIWEYHAEGISVRKIATLLRATRVIKIAKSTVGNTVKKLDNQMRELYMKDFSQRYRK